MIEFKEFPKIFRMSRPCVITEKIDGTNSSITITEDGQFLTASRTGWITPEKDNHGFSRWAHEHKNDLLKLGVGTHFGEWWGQGIQRGYGLNEKRWSLFNTERWGGKDSIKPACCHVVPILYTGIFTTQAVEEAIDYLRKNGSQAAPGFNKPEGVVMFHQQGNFALKKTLEKDDEHKTQN